MLLWRAGEYSRHPWRSPFAAVRLRAAFGVRSGILPTQSNPLRGYHSIAADKHKMARTRRAVLCLVEAAGIEPASEGAPRPALHA